MKYWITTDTHFGHRKLEEYSGRPSNFEDLIWKGLEKLTTTDCLIHLGDVCIGKDSEWHKKIQTLDCRLILVKGNHDGQSNSWYLEHGWDFVCDSFSMKFGGKNILFSHEPQDIGKFDLNIHGHFHNNLHRLLEGRYVIDGEEERNKDILCVLTPKHKLLAIEDTNYQPVKLETLT